MSPMKISKSVKRVFKKLNISRKAQKELGIISYSSLVSKKSCLESQAFNGVDRDTQERLVTLVQWTEYYKKLNKSCPSDPLKMFSRKSYQRFLVRTTIESRKNEVRNCYDLAVRCLHKEGGVTELAYLPKEDYKSFYDTGVSSIMGKYLNDELKSKAWCEPFLQLWIKDIVNLPEQKTCETPYVVFGHTQSGKSSMKAVVAAMCSELSCPLIIITRTVRGSLELASKLQDFARKSPKSHLADRIMSVTQNQGQLWSNRKHEIIKNLSKGGVLVAADTEAQVLKAAEALDWIWDEEKGDGAKKKFVLIVDEADTMYRTKDRTQKFEMGFDKLLGKGPCLKLFVTATPVPLLLILESEQGLSFKMLSMGRSYDYIGLDDMVPFEDENGRAQFLEPGSLKTDAGVELDGLFIPFTNKQVIRVYEDALANSKVGILLIDVTNPRVWVADNIFQKAEKVQSVYKERGKPIVVVVTVGSGVFYKLPSDNQFVQGDKSERLSDILTQIDEDIALSIPIFVFGFSMLSRGVSCRSQLRVPTHMVLGLSLGYSIEQMIQAMGRASFIGKGTLTKNLGQEAKVKVLTYGCDWDTMKAHQRFLLQIQSMMDDGKTYHEAKKAAQENLSPKYDFRCFSPRRVGQRKKGDLCSYYDKTFVFKGSSRNDLLSPHLNYVRNDLFDDRVAQRIMRLLNDLNSKEPKIELKVRTIKELYDDKYATSVTLGDITDQLNRLMKIGPLIEKKRNDDGFYWQVKNSDILNLFMNREIELDDAQNDSDFTWE